MKILAACHLPDEAREELRALGADVVYAPEIGGEELVEAIADIGILIVGRTRISAEVIAAARRLQMIVRAGTGLQNIALEEASTQGVLVCRCPHKNAVAIAELTLGLIVALDRGIVDHVCTLRREGTADEQTYATGLLGETLGLLGFTPVEREIARRARAFGMRPLAWSATLTPEAAEREGVGFCNWPAELVRQSNVVAAYVPPEAAGVVLGAELIGSLPDAARLVYVGQPGAIDQEALLAAMQERGVRAALDVYAAEPTGDAGRLFPALLEQRNFVGSYRLAGRTRQAWEANAAEAVRIVRRFLISGEVLNCVNLTERSPATWQLILRLRDTVGVMADVMEVIRTDGVNAEEITSRVFQGARAAWCTIALDERPSTEALEAIRSLDGVLHFELRAVV